MKSGLKLLLLLAILSCYAAAQVAPMPKPRIPQPHRVTTGPEPEMYVKELDGGSVITDLGMNIRMNAGSSLRRRWFVLNEPNCPVTLLDAGVRTVYESSAGRGSEDYYYAAAGELQPGLTEARAVEVRFLLFDPWGRHMHTLTGTTIRDLSPGERFPLRHSRWRAWENDVAELFTVVAFIANVRHGENSLWTYDGAQVRSAVETIKLEIGEESLKPSPRRQEY